MYPNISPTLKLEETISNPFEPAEVLGFIGRNTMLGRTAVIVKEPAISEDDNGPTVELPKEQTEIFAEENAELVVLLDTKVLAMDGTDFATERRLPTVHRGDKTVEMADVSLDNDRFRSFSQGQVEVGN